MEEVDVRKFEQHTALHLAAFKGKMEVCCILVEAGAEVNCTTNLGYTRLYIMLQGRAMLMYVSFLLRLAQRSTRQLPSN
jgi:hypothetical protein